MYVAIDILAAGTITCPHLMQNNIANNKKIKSECCPLDLTVNRNLFASRPLFLSLLPFKMLVLSKGISCSGDLIGILWGSCGLIHGEKEISSDGGNDTLYGESDKGDESSSKISEGILFGS